MIRVLTAVFRAGNIPFIRERLRRAYALEPVPAEWWLIGTCAKAECDSTSGLREVAITFEGTEPSGYPKLNHALDLIGDGYVCVLDDDTLPLDPYFLFASDVENGRHGGGFAAQLSRDGRRVRLYVHPRTVAPGIVDQQQWVLRRDIIAESRFEKSWRGCADGIFLTDSYRRGLERRASFLFRNDMCTTQHNAMREDEPNPTLAWMEEEPENFRRMVHAP